MSLLLLFNSGGGDQARQIIESETEDFVELLKLSGLDPKRHLCLADWSGVSFRGCDLRGFDFTGARLHGCDFNGALIAGARFDQAEIDSAAPIPTETSDRLELRMVEGRRTDLNMAADWPTYAAGWQPPKWRVHDVHLPIGAVFQDAPFAPELAIVPPGAFMMGSPPDAQRGRKRERPQHWVTISRAFAVGCHAVTMGEWLFAQHDPDWERLTGGKPVADLSEPLFPSRTCVYCKGRGLRRLSRGEQFCRECSGTGRIPDNKKLKQRDYPLTKASWRDAQLYVKWLRGKTDRPYRLLSEAEWEYCCQVGPHLFGNRMARLAPNRFGIYDMPGEVWEWVEDSWHADYTGAPDDGSAWMTGDERGKEGAVELCVLRGGRWGEEAVVLRNSHATNLARTQSGFRVARTLDL
jgi:formylglycine-generating enzyme required for sulfatase activity